MTETEWKELMDSVATAQRAASLAVAALLADPEALKPKIEAVARLLRPLWDEPVDDSGDVADCLQGLLCDFPDDDDSDAGSEVEQQKELLDELSGLLYRLPPIMLT